MLEGFVEEYSKRLYHLCLKLERDRERADELYQETWLRALKGWDTYDPLQEFYPWITKVCVNSFRTLLKKRAFEGMFLNFMSNEEREYFTDVQKNTHTPDGNDRLNEALKRLDYRKRLVVVLHYYEGYSVKEISSMAGIKEGTVKSRLHLAREELREALEDERL